MAQYTVTTLGAACDAVQTQITVASSTGMSSAQGTQSCLMIDDELMLVTSVVSSTVVNVLRNQFSTKPTKHGNGRAVYFATAPTFTQSGPLYQPGAANASITSGPSMPNTTPATVTTATAVTLTTGQVLGGIILEDPNGGAATATLPTAALMVAAMPGARIGTTIRFFVRNTADAAEVLTIAVGTGGTGSGTLTIAQNFSKEFLLRITEVLPGAETYTLYSLGSVAV